MRRSFGTTMAEPAPTYEEMSWYTGKLRIRCSLCGKVVMRDEAHAQDRAKLIRERAPETYMRAYFDRRCQHWHLKGKPRD